jgi:3-(3-hydroxy-phenyl)propionate hydroxylase
MTEHAVVIAGGGPTGLMLAGELALAKVDVAIVERRASQDLPGSRAGGLHSRTIEVLDQRGIADRFLSQGQVAQVAGFAWIPLDISDFPTRHNYGLGLWQNHIERILAGWVGELAVPIYYGSEVTGIAQDDTGVDVELADGRSLRAEYLVGCDGGRSLIRKAAGIEFSGWDPTTRHLIAEVELAEEPEWGLRRDALGIHSLSRMGDGGPVRRCDILSRTHKGGSGWAATCWVSRRSTRRRSRSLAARARTWGSFRGSKASACRLAFA